MAPTQSRKITPQEGAQSKADGSEGSRNEGLQSASELSEIPNNPNALAQDTAMPDASAQGDMLQVGQQDQPGNQIVAEGDLFNANQNNVPNGDEIVAQGDLVNGNQNNVPNGNQNNVSNGNEMIAQGDLPNGNQNNIPNGNQITLGVQENVFQLNMGQVFDIYAPRNVQINFFHGLHYTTIVFSGHVQVNNADMVHINLPADGQPDCLHGPYGIEHIIVPGAHVHNPGPVNFILGVQFVRGMEPNHQQVNGTQNLGVPQGLNAPGRNLGHQYVNGMQNNQYVNGMQNNQYFNNMQNNQYFNNMGGQNNNLVVVPNGLIARPTGIPPRPRPNPKPRKAPRRRACMNCSLGKMKCTKTEEGCARCTERELVCPLSPAATEEDSDDEEAEEAEEAEEGKEAEEAEEAEGPEEPEEPEEPESPESQ